MSLYHYMGSENLLLFWVLYLDCDLLPWVVVEEARAGHLLGKVSFGWRIDL